MLLRKVILIVLLIFARTIWAGTPDHLMWIAKDQDAVILGEVLNSGNDHSQKVKVLFVFPQTKFRVLSVGETFILEQGGKDHSLVSVGNKYLMSLNQQGNFWQKLSSNVFQIRWGAIELTHNSYNPRNARLVKPVLDGYQYMVSTAGKYPLPLYNYPSEITTNTETLQLPSELIDLMKTRELIDHWVNYPKLQDLYAFNQVQQGFDRIKSSFNGLIILLKRSDAAKILKGLFAEKDLSVFKLALTNDELDFFKKEQIALSILMAQPEILNKLSSSERNQLNKEVNRRLGIINTLPELRTSLVKVCYELLQQNLKN